MMGRVVAQVKSQRVAGALTELRMDQKQLLRRIRRVECFHQSVTIDARKTAVDNELARGMWQSKRAV